MDKQIISKFFELPKTNTAWWAFGLGLIFLLGIILFIIVITDQPSTKSDLGAFASKIIYISVVEIIVFIPSIKTSIKSYKSGERSWIAFIGYSPYILISLILVSATFFTIFVSIFY